MPRPLRRVLFWCALIGTGVLSLLPVTTLPPITFSVWDKAQHAIAFFVLGGLARAAYAVRSRVIVAAMLLYGAAIELAQGATGFRYADWRDWVADAVGVAVGVLVVLAIQGRRNR